MAKVIANELEVCEDCAVLAANGEGTAEHAARMVAVWGEDAIGLVITTDEEHGYTDFSSRRCDGCGSELAGTRHAAAVIR